MMTMSRLGQARDVRPAAAAGKLHDRMLPIGADRRGVEVPVAIDLRAADEAGIHVAALQQPHEVDRPRAPGRAGDVRGVPHRVEQLRGGGVAHHAQLEQADRVRRMGPLGDDERDERQPHPDEHDLAVGDLPRGLRDHDLPRGDVH